MIRFTIRDVLWLTVAVLSQSLFLIAMVVLTLLAAKAYRH
jgi:hypothetical protein